MRLQFTLVKKHNAVIPSEFLISPYPITVNQFTGRGSTKQAQRATWTEAIRFCNRLSKRRKLPLAYDESTGLLIDKRGVRLPTSDEWEYAAKGWSEQKTGVYLKILEQTYAFCDVDRERYFHGISELAKLEANTIGLYGMLGNAHEWCSEPNTLCHWDDYFANYDNAISYQVKTSICRDTDVYGFRIVLSSAGLG